MFDKSKRVYKFHFYIVIMLIKIHNGKNCLMTLNDTLQDKLEAVLNMCFVCEVDNFYPPIKVITLTIFRLG